jgi:predicted acetyltransferase
MPIAVRQLEADEIVTAGHTFTRAMQFAPLTGEDRELAKARAYPERSWAAFDGPLMVGHTRSYPFRTVVPGGSRLATAGITAVGTLPTHRRRGILSLLMAEQLRACHAAGEPLASLRASEASIYGRFGYGLAGLAASIEVSTHKGGLRDRLDDDGTFEYRHGPELLDTIPELHARCLRRPGELERPRPLWERALRPLLTSDPAAAHWLVVHRDRRGRLDGYVEWEALDRDHWHEKPATVEVGDLYGVDDRVEGLLWQFLMDLDLIEVVKIESRPLDDPIRWRLADPRALVVREIWDEQWVRLVDVPGALAARSYQPAAGTLVIEVADPILPENDGRYELSADGVRRVRARPDLRLGIDVLGAVYLGGVSVSELVAAGRITEVARGAAARADALLHHPVAPWCGTFF